jgi:hypothetical protein
MMKAGEICQDSPNNAQTIAHDMALAAQNALLIRAAAANLGVADPNLSRLNTPFIQHAEDIIDQQLQEHQS